MIYAPSVGTSPAFRQRVLARPSGTCSKDTERGFGRRSTRAAPTPIAQVLDVGERDVRVLGEGQHVKGELAQLQLRGVVLSVSPIDRRTSEGAPPQHVQSCARDYTCKARPPCD